MAYLDDILMYSNTMEEHHHHVREVIKRLLQHRLYAKLEKCAFDLKTVEFLGYVLSPFGVSMHTWKVEAVLLPPTPTSVKMLERFLGFSNFYRKFKQGFSEYTAALMRLL